jgi:sulfate/thiosulfate transport system ATP-binding protein
MRIGVNNVTKRFGAFAALAGVDLEIGSGELIALLGPSGSGKTTLLRIIAGLDWPDEGEIFFDGVNAQARSAGARNVGFVFQHYALFRHMTVFENVAFGLRVRRGAKRVAEDEINKRVGKLLDLVQLGWLAHRYPSQLSGGQRQRVALARALAIDPQVLLLDEPFGALDAKVRKELRRWLRNLHEDIHVTSVFVTHDQEEALELADRVVVMDGGRIEQIGTPQDVYERPATAFVHEFIGESVVLPITVTDGVARHGDEPVGLDSPGLRSGAGRLFVRPYEMAVVPIADAPLAGRVSRIHGLGPARRIEIALRSQDGAVVEIDVPRAGELAPGQEVGLRPRTYRIFAAAPQ